jgi:uncharacterized membrane protein YadS
VRREMSLAKWFKGARSSEDWWALWIGLFLVAIGLIGAVAGFDLTGWAVAFPKWVDIGKALRAAHPELVSGWASLILSYLIFSVVTCLGARIMRWDVRRYFLAWTVIFWLTAVLYILSRNAYVQGTAVDREKYGIGWSLSIGGAHYIVALLVGLIIGNLAPKRFREFLKTAARPEWFIKIAIVALGTKLGLKAIEATGFTMELLVAGASATIAAYLIFWPLAYTFCRKVFKLTREWAATLASGISICGVSAAIATGSAIRARAIVPIMISALVVVFAVFELLILPSVLTYSPWFNEPIAAGASLGLTVKTDGADAAAGAITDELMRNRAAGMGVFWEAGWILSAAIMTKIWIDMFIGIWAFLLAVIWVYHVEKRPGEKVEKMEIWWRFPKFVIGYFIAWFVVMGLGLSGVISPQSLEWGLKPVEGAMRHLFFMLTFTSIGLVTNFRELAKEGMGRLALAYGLILVVIIIPIGWGIAWLFHHGMVPPLATP